MSYTKRFLKAMPYIFEHEGKFNDVSSDKGGATNWGVSLKFLKSINKDIDGDGDVDWLDIKALDEEDAKEIYFNNFWKPFYETMTYEKLAIKLFDVCINAGFNRSNILFQKALNSLGSKISVDGVVGKVTLTEALKYKEDDVVTSYCKQQLAFYNSLVANDPSQSIFIKGWTKRANWKL